MPRSHPPALLRLVARTLKNEIGVTRGDRVLVACSGGPDSIALLHAMATLAPRLGVSVGVGAVDHGLRAEASEELRVAEDLAARLRVPYEAVRVDVAQGSNLQARARKARRAALEELATRDGYALIATGHHADDRAETVLLRLLRGAGPRGLAVLPARAEPWIRPLLRASRADVQRHLTRHGLTYATDPSNRDLRFTRARVRHELLPMLESLSPGIVGHLNALADQLREPPAPELRDDRGDPLHLGRAQIAQTRAALRDRRTVTVRVRGGALLHIEGKNGQLQLERPGTGRRPVHTADGSQALAPRTRDDDAPPTRNQPKFRRTSGGAKRHKSG